jgi:hypothetical protein
MLYKAATCPTEKMRFQVRNPESTAQTVHEAVGVFNDADSLQSALNDLQEHGFMRQELSILADVHVIEEKLGHIYKRVEDVEDDPKAPRTIFIPNETIGEAEGSAIGLPLYIAAVTAAGIVAASGGTFLTLIAATVGAGAVGASIGAIFASLISKYHSDFIQNQINHGGLLLWVHLRSPDLEEKAKEILRKHSAHDVHIHEIAIHE